MKKKPEYWYKQSSVIPFRKNEEDFEVLLITTRKKRKWILPKGIVDIGLTPKQSAVKEALEEAGIKGKLIPQKLLNYSYKKWGGKCDVEVFGLEVKIILDEWEESFRARKWVQLNEAEKFVHDPKILELLNNLFNELNRN